MGNLKKVLNDWCTHYMYVDSGCILTDNKGFGHIHRGQKILKHFLEIPTYMR
jgi:hypothetical protein